MNLNDAAKDFENSVAAIVDRGSNAAAVSDRGYNNKSFRDRNKLAALALCLALAWHLQPAPSARADTGVLIPISEKEEPDPALLSLLEMRASVRIDNQYCRTRLVQIFESHVGKILEGKYVFDLPAEALVSDFAVWDGVVRIPGVILERRKARNIYRILRQQAIDPGLLQQAESDAIEASSQFSARIVPIPGFGTKRLELEYSQWLPVENLRSRYVLPLKPARYRSQGASRLVLEVSLQSGLPLKQLRFAGSLIQPQIQRQDSHSFTAVLDRSGLEFTEDLVLEYELDAGNAPFWMITHPQEPAAPILSNTIEQPRDLVEDRRGFFMASLLPQAPAAPARPPSAPRQVVVLMDTSLSMQWEKLERSFQAVSSILSKLAPEDRFNLLLFNRTVNAFQPALLAATPAAVGQALDFIRSNTIENGSDLALALRRGMEMLKTTGTSRRYLVLVSDGNATLGQLATREILADVSRAQQEFAPTDPIRICPFGIGSDAHRTLLSELAAGNNGFSAGVRDTEELDFALESFNTRLASVPLQGLQLELAPAGAAEMVYAVDSGLAFPGSVRHWLGRLAPGAALLQAKAAATYSGANIDWRLSQNIRPEEIHSFLPRAWAKARVDALLRQIELEGESEAAINEIIRLAKRYNFVTPYTSFLAAPRALLRPRLIQPGDPMLRIRTDEDIESVTAIFPFGLVKQMTYLESEHVWQTRFLAPLSMNDGRYDCRLLLRDREGRTYQERKSFVIDSRPPRLQATIPTEARSGQLLQLTVRADSDTRFLRARLARFPGIQLQWSPEYKSSRGELRIPKELAPGSYEIEITAEDFAHNVSTLKHPIRITR